MGVIPWPFLLRKKGHEMANESQKPAKKNRLPNWLAVFAGAS
jgi:hypothetical protein